MIVVRLKGGLGNQMFQYAFACILAKKNNVSVKIDTSFFALFKNSKNITKRDFELSVFNNTYHEVSLKELKSFNQLSFLNKFKKKVGMNYPKKFGESSALLREYQFNLKPPVYLNGYFQSYRFYLGREDFVRNLFDFRINSLDDFNKALLLKIEKVNTISIHVRRGDYVSVPEINNVHGVCNLEYYLKAINLITEELDKATLIFFSDDCDWVKKTFSNLSQSKIIVDHNKGDESWKDMFLMSRCSHNIIANSTFSWWGAWLNLNPDKKVIAPKKWFRDSNKNINNLIPSEWIQL